MVDKRKRRASNHHNHPNTSKKAQKHHTGIYESIKNNKEAVALILILLLAVFLIAIFYAGVYWQFDDSTYVSFIQQINNHTFNPGSNPYAYGWLWPYFVFLGGIIFGFTSFGLVVPTALEYLSLIVLTYVLGSKVSKNKGVAIIAALLVCLFPFVVQYSTRLLNDMLLGVIATLSMIFFLSENKRVWILAGVMAGLLIYIKMIGLAYILPFGICALLSKKRKYVVWSMIITILLYTLPFLFLLHNPLYPFQNYGNDQNMISPATLHSNIEVLLLMMDFIQIKGSASLLYQDYSLGLLTVFTIIGTVIAAISKNRKIIYVAVLFWVFLLYLFFGTISLSRYVVAAVIIRYFILVAAPMAILISYSIISIANYMQTKVGGNRRWFGAAVVILLLILILLSLNQAYVLVFYYNTMIRQSPFGPPWWLKSY